MRVAQLSSCCCGCSLRGGVINIGYYYAVIGLAVGILCFAIPVMLSNNDDFDKGALNGVLIGTGVVLLIQSLSGIFLIVGVHKEKTGYLLPWMIVNAIYFVLSVALTIMSIVVTVQTQNTSFITAVVLEVFYAGVLLYFLLVVHSYRKPLLGTSTERKTVTS